MNQKYKDHFICPECAAPTILETYKQSGENVEQGLFNCENQHFYPLINGIPRFLPPTDLISNVRAEKLNAFFTAFRDRIPAAYWGNYDKLTHSSVVKPPNSFVANFYDFQWSKYGGEFSTLDNDEFKRLTGGSLDNLGEIDKAVDVGGGQGRYTRRLLEKGAREVVCLDLSEAIEISYGQFSDDPRVVCVQASLYEPPLRREFDFVMCIGVLHHLPDPEKGFDAIVQLAQPGGRVAAWVYSDSPIKPLLYTIRFFSAKLPLSISWQLAGAAAALRYGFSATGKVLRRMNLGKLANLLPMSVYEGYSFHYYRVNSFDHLSTVIINLYKREDLEKWLVGHEFEYQDIIHTNSGKAGAGFVIYIQKKHGQNAS